VSLIGRFWVSPEGYLAPAEKWVDFCGEWQELLSEYKVTHLHAKELRSRHAKLYRHLDFSTRRVLVERACAIICRTVDVGLSVYMRPSDWKLYTNANQRNRWGSTYIACTNALIALCANHVNGPERVSVFMESGHVNAEGAIKAIREYKQITEPVEWPDMTGEVLDYPIDDPELALRKSAMRIGGVGLADKKDTYPLQAADLFAYLVATAMREDNPVLNGVLDILIKNNPHAVFGFGPGDVVKLVDLVSAEEAVQAEKRAGIYEMKKVLRSEGFKVHELPWGLAINNQPNEDELSREFDRQSLDIRNRNKRIAE